MAKTEGDPEIQDLLRKSEGLNIALDYLPGSITFDPIVDIAIAGKSRLASSIVWFDALVTNVDRTAKNTNLLVWHRNLWMIDHGATLIFHHNWADAANRSRLPFARIADHVLLRWASEIRGVDEELAALLTPDAIASIIELIPEDWLDADRSAYRDYLLERLAPPRDWMEEAVRAQALRV
jgi:hypothetical protein